MRAVLRRLLALFRYERLERDIDDELAFHVEMRRSERTREARTRTFRNMLTTKERARDVWRFRWLEDVVRDLRFAARALIRQPGFAAIVTTILAFGIGGTITVFSFVDMILVRELPYAGADRIVTLWQTPTEALTDRDGVAPSTFLEWRTRLTTVASLSAAEPASFDVVVGSEPVTLSGALVTEGFFEAIGGQPFIGRGFVATDFTDAPERVVVVSYGLWQRLFGGDWAALTRDVVLEGQPRRIVGVLPEWFKPRLPDRIRDVDVWAPKVIQPSERSDYRARFWKVIGRLRPGADLAAAQSEVNTVTRQLAVEQPQTMAAMAGIVEPFRRHLAGPTRDPLLLLLAAVVLVLLIACANVMTLLVARGIRREREFAIRVAIGAGRSRLVRQLLVESLVLGLLGGGLGLVVAYWAIDLVMALRPAALAQFARPSLDGRLLLVSTAVTLVAAGASGMWPMLGWSRNAVMQSRIESGGHAHRPLLSQALVVAQVMLAVVLVVAAALVVRSFVGVLSVDPGFRRSNVAVLQVFTYGQRYPTDTQRIAFFDEATARLRSTPGVERVGLVSAMPFGPANINIQGAVRLDDQANPANRLPITSLTVATTEYFHALDIPLLHGRLFAETDHASAIPVAVVNETMADRLWPAGDAVGRRVSVNWRGRWRAVDVVGVVGSLRHEGLESTTRPELFMPLQQAPFGSMTFVVRTVSEPALLLPSLRRQIWAVDPSLPFFATATVDDLLADSIAPRRFVTMLLTLLGLLGFVIAVSGIYGVISYLTESRTREFGVRMALGVRASDIRRLVFGRASVLSGAGVLLGLIVSAVVTQSIESMLFDVTTLDGATYVATAAIFALAALLAAFGPARRATSVDPFTALRSE